MINEKCIDYDDCLQCVIVPSPSNKEPVVNCFPRLKHIIAAKKVSGILATCWKSDVGYSATIQPRLLDIKPYLHLTGSHFAL